MRRFQNILYVTRGAEDETDSLKQALCLARNNATQLHALIISPMLPKYLAEYEPGFERRVGFRAPDTQLLRLYPCPVWLCRPVSRSRNELRVAVAVDPQSVEPAGRDLALQLLRLSRSLADTCSGELTVVFRWDFEFEDYLRYSRGAVSPVKAY
jgi:hypothetical protein